MPLGKYFLVRSRLSKSLALEPLDGGTVAGTPAVAAARSAEGDGGPDVGADTQYWYECQVTGTIRNKRSDLCLELNDEGTLMINTYVEDNKNQEWTIAKDRIQDKNDQKKVLQIVGASDEPGSKIEVAEFTNSENQLWDLEIQNSEYFHIVSKLHNKVVTIKDSKKEPGAKVIMWEKHPEPTDNQLWYEDKHAIIKSKLNNFVLECSKAEVGEPFVVNPYSAGEIKQLWTRYGECIASRVHPKQVLTVRKKNKDNGAKVVVGEQKVADHQHWIFEPVFL